MVFVFLQGVSKETDAQIIDYITRGLGKAETAAATSNDTTSNTLQSRMDMMMNMCLLSMMDRMTNNNNMNIPSTTNNAIPTAPPNTALPATSTNNALPPSISNETSTILPPLPAPATLAPNMKNESNASYGPRRGSTVSVAATRYEPIAKFLPKL